MTLDAKVRVVVFEVAGGSQAVQDAMRTMTSLLQPRGAEAVEAQAPVVTVPKLLRAPRTAKPRKPRANAAEVLPPIPASRPLSVTDAIRQAVKDGPKTNEEVRIYIEKLGFKVTSGDISSRLCALRNANEVYKRDADLRWCRAEKAARS